MKRIAIFGGTFNPIHIGHVIIAEEIYKTLKLDRIVFIPAYIPPHKKRTNLVSAKDRYMMVKKAISNNKNFTVSDLEIKRKGKSYTIDTLKEFKSIYDKKAKLFFIIGSDTLTELKDWKNIDKVLELVQFVVVNRPGFALGYLPANVVIVDIPQIDISSSQIRRRIKDKKSIQYLVPESVRRYIIAKRLYRK